MPNTSTRCFRLALFGKPRHWTKWMLIVDWLIFRHGVFPAVKSNRVENVPCDVTREILLNIIHTYQIKIRQKKLRNLFTPSAIFFATKFHVFVIMSKGTSEVFSSYQRNRTVLSFRERYSLTVWYQTNCGYDGTKRGFTICYLIVTKRTKLFFLYLSNNLFSDNKHKLIFIEYQITHIPHIKKVANYL